MKKFIISIAFGVLSFFCIAQDVKFENDSIYYEYIIDATNLTAEQILSAAQLITPLGEIAHENVSIVAMNNKSNITVIVRTIKNNGVNKFSIRANCFAKDGKLKIVFDNFGIYKKNIDGRGTSEHPLVTVSDITEQDKEFLTQHVVKMAKDIETRVLKAKEYWNF